jgi:hypothetical protein
MKALPCQPAQPSSSSEFWHSALILLVVVVSLTGCTGRPLVQGLFEPGGTIYRESEQEEWGARSTVKIQGLEF